MLKIQQFGIWSLARPMPILLLVFRQEKKEFHESRPDLQAIAEFRAFGGALADNPAPTNDDK
ncbi:MAG: hypothetical protein JNL84_10780 [Candidatus Accumulibacter sp.]|nr:hypothetical protein [Accumulibacter sp.]